MSDLPRHMASPVAKESHDPFLRRVERRPADPRQMQGHPKSRPDLFEHRLGEPRVATGRRHPLNATSPLLDESECVEDATNHTIPEFRDTARQVLERQAE